MIGRIIELIKKYTSSPEEWGRKKGVKIGKGCFISTREFPSEGYLIEIGDNVRIAPKTSFYTHGGIWSLRKIYNDPELDYFGKIKIGNNTYIGENCMIMPGVTIGERCIIGAGTIVTKSIPDGVMVAGNPCRFIGYTESFYKKLKKSSDLRSTGLTLDEKRKFLLSQPDDMFVKKPMIKILEK